MEISILTGYREFDYCQKAIQISAETIQYDGAGRSIKGDDRVPEK